MSTVLTNACSNVKASLQDINNFFQKLSHNPELYQFDSHQGFRFIKGNLLTQNSIFFTKEKFLGIFIKLKFKVIKIKTNQEFHFQLIQPLKNLKLKGKFSIKQHNVKQCKLCLSIYQDNLNQFNKITFKLLFFLFSPIKHLVKKQITKEVLFLKQSIEENYTKN